MKCGSSSIQFGLQLLVNRDLLFVQRNFCGFIVGKITGIVMPEPKMRIDKQTTER
jgi:hypothetical protein